MADTFVVRLLADDTAEWTVVDGMGARLSGPETGPLSVAGSAAGGRRKVVLVPGEEVTLTEVDVPVKNTARLLQLVPYALEEQLATDIESLHFALGKARPDGRVPVAVVSRERLRTWLDALIAVGLDPDAVYPDTLALPANPGHSVVLLDGQRLLVRHPDQLPVVLDAAPVASALELAGLPAADPITASAQSVLVYASPSDWETAGEPFTALQDKVGELRVQILGDGALPWLAAGAVSAPSINLLQGGFAPRRGFGTQWQRWRLAAILAGVLFGLHLLANGVDLFRIHREEARVDALLTSAVHDALPDVQKIVDPRRQVEAQLAAARTGAIGANSLLGTLAAIAAAVTQAPGATLDAVSYRDGITDLKVNAPDVGSLDKLQQAVTAQGFAADLQGAQQHDNRYEGRLQLKGAGT